MSSKTINMDVARLNHAIRNSNLLMRQGDTSAAARHLDEASRSGPQSAADELQELRAHVEPTAGAPATSRERLDDMFERLLSGPPSPLFQGIETARRALRAGDNPRAIAAIKAALDPLGIMNPGAVVEPPRGA